MIENELEFHNSKLEAKVILRKAIIGFIIFVFGSFMFLNAFNKTNLSGQDDNLSISQIAKFVLYFCIVIYSGILATRNLLFAIREYVISKDKFNFIAVTISVLTLVGIAVLIIRKAMALAGII